MKIKGKFTFCVPSIFLFAYDIVYIILLATSSGLSIAKLFNAFNK